MKEIKPRGNIFLRNKIIEHLNNWPLGCHVFSGDKFFEKKWDKESHNFERLIFGVSEHGLAILIYPLKRNGHVPKSVAQMMMDFETRGGITGCAAEINDAWDIVSNDPERDKRKSRTYKYRHFHRVYNSKKDRESEE